jgi:aspartyl-tRNA(Asn)/glutamyl-tRNA(Gln) amidotransferase subunit C
MTLSRKDVERIAQLAALHVDEAQLPQLADQIARIIEYVSQLEAADTESQAATWLAKSPPQPLRADEVAPADLQHDLASFAPALREDLFVVPRLSAMEDE